ncbi:hypothetical protein ACWDR3_45230 [Streptomyces sp. NPDC001002]
MIRATDPSDPGPIPLALHSAHLVNVFRDALIRMRDGEELRAEVLDAAAELLRMVQAPNGDALAAEVMPLFRQVFEGDNGGSDRPASAMSPRRPTHSRSSCKGSL